MQKSIIYLLTLVLLTGCVQNNDPSPSSDPCDEFSPKLFEWIPNEENDTVFVLVDNKEEQFVFTENRYTYDSETYTPGVFSAGEFHCENFWTCRLNNDENRFISLYLDEDDITKAYLTINLSPYYFKELQKSNNGEFAIFEVDSLNDSSRVERIVLEKNVGFKRLELRKRKNDDSIKL